MSKDYKLGTFCIDIKCPKHKAIEGLDENAYIERKKEQCKKCEAWQFFIWSKEKYYHIVKTAPQMSNKELAARIRGLDIVRIEDLTEDEIMCL